MSVKNGATFSISCFIARVKGVSWHWETILSVLLLFATVCSSIIQFIYLTKYPKVHIDESWYANAAWNWLKEGINFDSMHAEARKNVIWPYIGNLPLLLSFNFFGLGLFQARLVSWIAGIFLLGITALVGQKSYGGITGALASLLLVLSIPFSQSSHIVRPDILLSVLAILCYFLVLNGFNKNLWWAHFLSGLLISVSLDIHQNAIIIGIGLFSLYLYHYRSKVFKEAGSWMFLLGGLFGMIYYVCIVVLPDPNKFITYFRFATGVSHPMPLLSFNLLNLFDSVREEILRYGFYQNNLDFVLILSGMVYLFFRRTKIDRLLLTYTCTVFVGFVLLAGNKSFIYAIILYPFFILIVAETLGSLTLKVPSSRINRVFIVTLVILYIFSSGLHLLMSFDDHKNYDYETTVEKMTSVIPPKSRVLGLPVWWLGFADYDFHSIESLTYFFFTKGYSLTKSLEVIKPSYVILDEDVEIRLSDQNYITNYLRDTDNTPWDDFEEFINLRGLKIIEFSDSAHGNIVIYQITWDK